MVIFEEAGKLLITKDSPFLKATSVPESFILMFNFSLNESLLNSGIGNLTLKQYANAMGIPKSRSCIQIIEHYFPNLISYRREGAGIMIWLNREVFEGQDLEEE